MKTVVTTVIVVIVALWVALLMGTSQARIHPVADVNIPSDAVYKLETHNMAGERLYVIYDAAGYQTYVNASQFESIKVPQKISDSLYKLPDGSYVTGITK
jgi:hypothetical protein